MEIYKNKLIMIKEENFEYNQKLCSSKISVDFIRNILKIQNEPEEVIQVIGLDTKLNVVGFTDISRGTLTDSNTTGRELFKRVLLMNCCKIILVHNHPTGDATPSKSDFDFTSKIQKICDLFQIQLLDHIIIGDEGKNYSILAKNYI